jgi:hypothetical protein
MERNSHTLRSPNERPIPQPLQSWVTESMTPATADAMKRLADDASDVVRMDELRQLASHRQGPCVSLYFPLEARGADVRQNPAVLKNLLRQAEDHLEQWPLEAEEVDTLLTPARKLLRDKAFWKQQVGGMAAFLSPETSTFYRLPGVTTERLRVADRFDLAPLLRLASEAGTFYVLAVSLNAVRVLQGASAGFRKLDIPGLPADFESAMGYEQYDSSVQYHSASPGGQGKQPPLVHGHGDSDEDRFKKDILNYFRRIADELLPVIDRDAPIVLAAVGSYFPMCRQAFGEDRVLESGVEGNPELLSDLELWRRARSEAVLPAHTARRQGAAEHVRELADRARIAHGFEDLAMASLHGRIDTLLIDPAVEERGAVDTEHCHVKLHTAEDADGEDLVALVLGETLANGGDVVPMTQAEAGDVELPAAILRY